ncbi:MAG: hypothetical protein ABSD64_03525 [Terriglobales bacterium]|jgi:hypothetical protein
MKPRTVLLITTALALSYSAFGKEANQGRKILITSIERHKNSTDSPYKVEGKTSGPESTLYYKLACKGGAADLEVGHLYNAQEVTEEGTKTLVIYHRIERDPSVVGTICDVESVKIGTKGSRE